MSVETHWRAVMSFVAAILCHAVQPAYCCTTFCLAEDGQVLFGKNYDWHVGEGYVIANKRDVAKTAIADTNGVSWVSRYGSATFNQFGREMPSGGMNEAGLVVELLWLEETEYASPDKRPAIGNLQWIQYQLDNHSSVAQVIASDRDIRIQPRAAAYVHYLVCDRSGACASIEFLDGRMVVHGGSDLPAKVLTNNTYEESIEFLKTLRGFGGMLPMPNDNSSLGRFARATHMAAAFEPQRVPKNVAFAFDILDKVSAGDYTKWSIVYDVSGGRVHFRTFESPAVREIDLSSLDFSCTKPVKAAPLNDKSSGDITQKLIVYTPRRNRDLVERTFSRTDFLTGVPREVWEENWRYPETTKCGGR